MLSLVISPAVLGNHRTVLGCILECLEHIRSLIHGRVNHLDTHYPDSGNVRVSSSGHAADSYSVVVGGGDSTGHVGTVIHRMDGRIAGHEVVSVDIIHISVAVIVPAIAGNLRLIGPCIRLKIGMVEIDAAVQDSHYHIAASEYAVLVPGPLEAHINALSEAKLARVVVMPLMGCVIWVVHCHGHFPDLVDRFSAHYAAA